ncbi:MAG: acetylesterase [Elusimicrobia bacterium RIFOXYC2_FULL_34_12]|nr:MAG: acetylesterase [Elusimicrobia bacterium RIFOXYC2_FULL_34_12]OGS39190.1 MAG: acetylesterase [Elusimicrobia bacterium RIFOXYD2_FULL_34_30]HAM38036.1 acetylesterase [Elusimicrobiota bacterium]
MSLIFGMSLRKLKEYKGRNPRPKDFDKFWERGLSEMNSIAPKIKIVPAKFQVPFCKCLHLYFTGVGGARVHAKVLRPKKPAKKHPAILMFHGYSCSSGDWYNKLAYAALGYTVAYLDCRGQGGLSEDKGGVTGWTLHGHIVRGLSDSPEKLLFRNIFLDVAQIAKIVMEMSDVDENRVGAIGGSMGGALSLVCAALEPRIRRVAPNYPFLCDYKGVCEMDVTKTAYAEFHDYFRKFDPLHEREEEFFNKLGYIDVQHFCSRIKAEVLMGTGLMDTDCPPFSQFAAYNKIKSKKTLEIYPDFAHEDFPYHNDKIFQFMSNL